MGLTLADFPRPAFYRDIASVVRRTGDVTIVVLVDGEVNAISEFLLEWARLFSGVRLLIVCPEYALDKLSGLEPMRSPCVTLVPVARWEAATLPSDLLEVLGKLAVNPDIFVSCLPYDSYGVVLKKNIEFCALRLVERWNAVYMVHDPVFKTVRVLDKILLRDRLLNRPRRLKIYFLTVRIMFVIAGVASRFSQQHHRGWRKV